MHHNKKSSGRPSRASVYEQIDGAMQQLTTEFGGLPSPQEAESIWSSLWVHQAHHSTALEGNTLVLSQVELLLAEGRVVGNKELREYLEVTGYAQAAQWVYGQALEIGEWKGGDLLSIHRDSPRPCSSTWSSLGSVPPSPRDRTGATG